MAGIARPAIQNPPVSNIRAISVAGHLRIDIGFDGEADIGLGRAAIVSVLMSASLKRGISSPTGYRARVKSMGSR